LNLMIWAATRRRDGKTMGERFAELVAVNGGTTAIHEFGKSTQSNANRWGRVGLTTPEGLELANMTGQVSLLQAIFPHQSVEFSNLVKRIVGGSMIEIATDLSVLRR
jgi:hypothetical protein